MARLDSLHRIHHTVHRRPEAARQVKKSSRLNILSHGLLEIDALGFQGPSSGLIEKIEALDEISTGADHCGFRLYQVPLGFDQPASRPHANFETGLLSLHPFPGGIHGSF